MNNPIIFLKEVIFLAIIIGFILKKIYKNSDFLKNNSFFHIVGINPITIEKNFKIKKEDEYLFKKPIKKNIESNHFGLCKNANVLIISIESLGQKYIKYYGGKANLPIFDELAKIGLVSQNHYCISANTNNALTHLYHDDYFETDGYLNNLKNYDSWFLTSQNVNAFKLKESIKSAGFKHIIDQQSLKESFNITQTSPWGMTDDFIYNQEMTQFLSQRDKNKPFFMHILNAQTHVNYHVADTKKYNNFNNNSNYGRYLNAIEESNMMIENVINNLKDNNLLDNTIVVICGDHGESFGKQGYKVHSNSIIAEQILTPLLIWHPKIKKSTIKLSSHFDIMPTIFDLLGMKSQAKYGHSLFSNAEFLPFALYTKTNRGKVPSSFGYVEKDKKILVDNIYKKITYMNHDDEVIKNLSTQEEKYYFTLASKIFTNQKGFV
jgi:arylsulfatase A-like enzyme